MTDKNRILELGDGYEVSEHGAQRRGPYGGCPLTQGRYDAAISAAALHAAHGFARGEPKAMSVAHGCLKEAVWIRESAPWITKGCIEVGLEQLLVEHSQKIV